MSTKPARTISEQEISNAIRSKREDVPTDPDEHARPIYASLKQ